MIVKDHTDTLPLVDHETLRRWLLKAGLWSAARTRKAHRRKRERRQKIGSLIQFDGSHHDWFEGRGPACCLLVAIDDASGRVFMHFAPSENAHDVLATLKAYVEHYGIPREIYTDKAKIYHPPSKGERLTDVGRALARLGVTMILAHSPQAKGRVERSNRTHQDRLVKALRQNRISTIDAANRFLEHTYLKEHNTRFAHPDGLRDIHRPSDGLDLDNIFCFETTRRLYNDYTITLDNQFIQLEKSEAPLPPPGRSVTLRTWLDGSLHLFWNEQELALTPLAARPAVAVQPSQNPGQASTHPWRHKNPIGPGGRYLVEKRTMKSTTTQKKKSVSSNPAPP